jgi:hypothetical protein
MPAGTDRAQRTTTPVAPPVRRWPVTLAVVVVGLLLLAWDGWAAMINTAPFFGDVPSRDRYVESGITMVTAAVPVVLLFALGLVLGSRFGLLFLAAPAALVVVAGLDLMRHPGDPSDPHPTRPVRWSDLLVDLSRPNWLAAAAVLVLLGLVLGRRRRPTGIRVDPKRARGAT